MKFVPVDNIPKRRTREGAACAEWKPLRDYLNEFLNMNVKYARISDVSSEYSSIESAVCSIRESIANAALPITLALRNGEVYLIRTDWEGEV